jgi:hypothetical protein
VTRQASRTWNLYPAELALLALEVDMEQLLFLDGGVGLLHVGADLDEARRSLDRRRTITRDASGGPSERHDIEILLRHLRDAPAHLQVRIDSVDSSEPRIYMIGRADRAVLTVGPKSVGSLVMFALEESVGDDLVDRVADLVGLAALPEQSNGEGVSGPSLGLRDVHVGRVRELVCTHSPDAAVEILLAAAWNIDTAQRLVEDLSDGFNAVEVRAVRRDGARLAIDELTFATTKVGSCWTIQQDLSMREIRFARTSRRTLLTRLEEVLIQL